jgi:ribose transport system substrate-binding protein
MRRTLSALIAVVPVTALLATACSTGSSNASSNQKSQQNTTASDTQAIVASYQGSLAHLPSTFGAPIKKALKIGWSSALDANELVHRLGDALEREVARQGGTFEKYDANGAPDQQVSQFQQLINDKVDAIVVWPLDANALGPSVKQARNAGIPVVAMEANPAGNNAGGFTSQVIFGRDLQAYVQARVMQKLHPGADVAVAAFAVPVPSIVQYAARAKYWAEQVGLKVVASVDNPSDDVAGGEKVATPLLSKFPQLAGLFAYNDPTAIGAAAAARSATLGLTTFGNNGGDDGLNAIKSGKESLTIQPPFLTWAKELVAAAYLAKENPDKALPPTVFPGLGMVITKDNVNEAKSMTQQIKDEYGH